MKDNKKEVLRRFHSLERRFWKDSDYAVRYFTMLNDYIPHGHARFITLEELKNAPPWTFYLTHHGVTYLHKPDKVWVVFDSQLLKGSDFLLGVFLRFRDNSMVLISDIEKMFHQVKVRPRNRLLFASSGGTLVTTDHSSPLVYQMTVHVFGGLFSFSSCAFALR